MKGALTIGGLLIALGVGYFVYTKSLTSSGVSQAPPQEQIDVTSIRMALLEIATAERTYSAGHGNYGTFEQRRADGAPALGMDRRGYTFQLELNGSQGFKATATPTDTNKQGWPTLSIDASMQIAER